MKLMRDIAGFSGPDADTQKQELFAACQNGTATPEQFHTAVGLFNIGQVSEVLLKLHPKIAYLSPGMLAGNVTREKLGPINDRAMKLSTVPGQVNAATVQELTQILGELEQIVNEAAADNAGRPDALYFCGTTAHSLGDATANLGDSAAALDWYAKSAAFFDEANNSEKAAEAREKAAALELRLSGDTDRATQRILGPLYDPAHPPEPLPLAVAYASLIRVMNAAGDAFGAGDAAARAAAAFEKLGFLDPEKGNAENALDSWVAKACELTSGKPVYALLMKVCDSYLQVFSGRVAKFAAAPGERARQNQNLAVNMSAITARITQETVDAENSLALAIEPYFPHAFKKFEVDNSFEQQIKKLLALDAELQQSRGMADQLSEAGQSVQPALTKLDQLEPRILETMMPLYAAKWKLAYAYIHNAAGGQQKVFDSAEEARTLILGGRPAKLSSFQQTFERELYLEALVAKMGALMRMGNAKDGLTLCLETIKDFEESRALVNSPLRQSTLLKSTAPFYTGAAFASFKLQEWDTLLQITDLVKARSALRSRLSSNVADAESASLAKQFDELTAAMQEAETGPSQLDPEKLRDLKDRRRDLWDLLSIARARSAAAAQPPALTVQALQKTLAPDEALLGYFFLNPTVLLIIKADRERFDVERLLLTEDSIAPVNDLLDAIKDMYATGLMKLDAAIAAAGEVLMPASVRQFVEGKSRVIVCPHHGLHLFPFHAASWDGKFLIDRCAVRYVPNFTSLLIEWRGQVGTGVFALSVSHFDVPGQPWPELTNTEEQVREIAGLYGALGQKADVLTGATTKAFRELASPGTLSGYSSLHFATHGTSVFAPETQAQREKPEPGQGTEVDNEPEPMESKLVLQNGWIDGLELASLQLPARVAVLSACNSGQRAIGGRGMSELPGDDIFGLQSALFHSGVQTVLGTLWPVETDAAYQITAGFHLNFAHGDPPEVALRKAMLHYREAASEAGTVSWAPFFLSSLGKAPDSTPIYTGGHA